MRVPIVFVAAMLAAPWLGAEQMNEAAAVALLAPRKPLAVRADSKAPAAAVARLHLWVGKDGAVEATEEVCGDRELFDDIVDDVLDFQFKHAGAFQTDISFVRRGSRVWLVLEMPEASRPKKDICGK
jgi:hypothetical protein